MLSIRTISAKVFAWSAVFPKVKASLLWALKGILIITFLFLLPKVHADTLTHNKPKVPDKRDSGTLKANQRSPTAQKAPAAAEQMLSSPVSPAQRSPAAAEPIPISPVLPAAAAGTTQTTTAPDQHQRTDSQDVLPYQGQITGNNWSFKFHRPSRQFAPVMRASHRKYFASRREALSAGMRPCSWCFPTYSLEVSGRILH